MTWKGHRTASAKIRQEKQISSGETEVCLVATGLFSSALVCIYYSEENAKQGVCSRKLKCKALKFMDRPPANCFYSWESCALPTVPLLLTPLAGPLTRAGLCLLMNILDEASDCCIKHSFYQKGMIILLKNGFMLSLPVISKVRQYKETKPQKLQL